MRAGFRVAVLAACLAAPAGAQSGGWRPAGVLEMAPGEEMGTLTLSPRGDLVAGTVVQGDQFGGVLWSVVDGRRRAVLAQGFPLYAPFRFAGDPAQDGAARLYSFGRDGMRLWSLAGGPPLRDIPLGEGVNDVLHDPWRDTFLVGQDSGPLLILDREGVEGARIETDALRPHWGIWLTGEGTRLVVAADTITLTAPMDGLPPGCAPCDQAYARLPAAYGPYEELIAVDTAGGRIATLPPVDPVRAGQQDGVSRAVAVPSIRVWEPVADWSPPDLPLAELALGQPPVWAEFSGDGRHLVTVTTHGALTLWNVETGRAVMALDRLPDDWIAEAHFVPASKTLYVTTGLGRAYAMQIGDGALLQEFPAPNTEVVFTADGRGMITSGLGAGPARLWRR